jgi:23S rRNA pseudouridine2457 synthase
MSRYVALFKPYGVLSSFTHEERVAPPPTPPQKGGEVADEKTLRVSSEKRTLSEFDLPKGVYAAGRLDFDSEGLLILSDDGAFIHRLTDPLHKLPKTYYAQVEGEPADAMLEPLRRGLRIKDYRTLPCGARILPEAPALPPRDKPITPHGPTAWLELILTEGKKRQVRHMTAAVGLPTLRLVRVQIGPVTLAGLQPGQWRDLSKSELAPIMQSQSASRHTQRQSRRSPRVRSRANRSQKRNTSGEKS